MQLRQPANMRLINHRLIPGRLRMLVILPVVIFRRDHALRHDVSAIAFISLVNPALQTSVIHYPAIKLAGARIQQQLMRIEAQPLRRLERSIDPKP